MDDWFGALLHTGEVAIQTAGNVGVAQAQAQGQAAAAYGSLANQNAAFAQSFALKTSTGFGSPNMVLIIMVGVAALFIINQANK